MKFKIWHLLVFTLVAALVIRSVVKRDSFPYQTREAASRVNNFGWSLVGFEGDNEGPYRSVQGYVEGVPVDKTAPPTGSMTVSYQVDGQAKIYAIPTADKAATHVRVFENPKGNHLLVITKKPW